MRLPPQIAGVAGRVRSVRSAWSIAGLVPAQPQCTCPAGNARNCPASGQVNMCACNTVTKACGHKQYLYTEPVTDDQGNDHKKNCPGNSHCIQNAVPGWGTRVWRALTGADV